MATSKLPVLTLEKLNATAPNTAVESLGILFSSSTAEYLEATMPVDSRTHQPYGFLHGGASALLAETVGSVGANLLIDQNTQLCFGIELNCSHLSSVRDGKVTGRATPIRIGKTLQVWDIQIRSDAGKLVCVSRLTMAVTEKK